MSRYEKTGRMFRILEILRHAAAGVRLEHMAAELECSPRTVRRYLEAMQSEALYPVYTERTTQGVVWKLLATRHSDAPLTPISPDEVMAIVLARKLLASKGQMSPLTDALDHLLQRIRRQRGQAFASFVEAIDHAVVATPTSLEVPAAIPHQFAAVAQAIQDHRKIRFDYTNVEGITTEARVVAPLTFCLVEGRLFLIAHCYLRNAIRQFVPERIASLTVLDEPIDGEIDFDAERFAAASLGAWTSTPEEVVLRLAHWMPEIFTRNPLHPTQQLSWENGQPYLRCTVGIDWALVRSICRFGWTVEVIAPAHLRQWVAGFITDTAKMYQQNAASPQTM